MRFRVSEFDPAWLHRPRPRKAIEHFRRAAVAAIVSKAYQNNSQVIESEWYRNESVYFIAKGFEVLAFETAEGGTKSLAETHARMIGVD